MPKDMQFQLSGLSCASCVGRAEQALRGVEGVETVKVNLANATAYVTLEAQALPSAILALDKAGYPANSAQTVLNIVGMSCASCVARVEKTLAEVAGVQSASVNLATQTAQVRFIDGTTDPKALAAAVTQSGYETVVAETAEHNDNSSSEAEKLRRATLIAAILTIPVFILEMGGHLFPSFHHFIGRTIGLQTSWVIQFILTSLVLLGPGQIFFRKGVPALLRGAPEMNALVVLGTSAAWGYSTLATFVPGVFPQGTRAVFFEAAAVIATLILLGRWAEARAKGRTGAAIKRLAGLRPQTAHVIRSGEVLTVPLDQVLVNDVIVVKPGAQIPTDGCVTQGTSWVDESMISGEPLPVEKSAGQHVTGGTINGNGAFQFQATAVGEATVLSQIIQMVSMAQGAKLPVQALVDRITAVFVPIVMVLAAATILIWLSIGPEPVLAFALVAGVSVLIIACPCAMGLATPTSIIVGIGRAADAGVLFRKGDALQSLETTQVIAFDKTGTLTAGRPELTSLILAPGHDKAEVLPILAAVERHSEHPIAQAIVRAAGTADLPAVSDFQSVTGMGAKATAGDSTVLIGADRFMAENDIALGDMAKAGKDIAQQGATPLFAALNGKIVAAIGVTDPIKSDTALAIQDLHNLGLKVAMITGDNTTTANIIARKLGIDHVVAEVLPAGKVSALKDLQDRAGRVAFVGDGINDAPALATADVGIAVGNGTDVAIEAADVVLMSGSISGVAKALTVSRATMRNIRQNLFWAFGYNAALIPVAAGVLYPFYGITLSPMLAGGAMALSSVFVVTNALRLRRLPLASA